jgi:hypothetical protein
MHQPRRSGRAFSLLVLMAYLLVVIRLVAGVVCSTCFNEFEQHPVRTFHLHGGGDHQACHHGRAPLNPLVGWACAVTQDESAFILPEIPRLPAVVSLFVPLVPLLVSHADRPLVTAHGRGPPVSRV